MCPRSCGQRQPAIECCPQGETQGRGAEVRRVLGCERGSVQHRHHRGLYLLRPCRLPPPAPPPDSPFLPQTSREMVARSAATLITHPFHVITLRCMVQFIGRETKYSGTLSAFATIYREEGVLGFFAGLIPRLLGDILSLWLCNMLAYLINTYALENGVSTMAEMKSYSQAVTGFFASMLTYPFVLVSNLMAVNNCGLAGGLLPYAPTYSSWLDCWSQLHREGNMSRGNSLFFRKVPAGKRYVWEERRFR
uniref:Mitochondrial carrier 2 n=1 Tax=Accipiter nisus TaxID=211598 RepID=A0A8B9MRQ8_9AVES